MRTTNLTAMSKAQTSKARLWSALVAVLALLLAMPAAAEWWDWAAPRVVDADDVMLQRFRDREPFRGDVNPRSGEDRVRDDDWDRDDDRDRRDDDDERWERDDDRRDRDDDRWERGDDRYRGKARGRSKARGRGHRPPGARGGPPGEGSDVPAFCRTGEGHPVFGMSWCHGNRTGPAFCHTGEGHPELGLAWCAERGFLPESAAWRPWDRRDVIFDRRAYPRLEGAFGEPVLEELLGDVIYRRLLTERSALGVDGDLEGRWYDPLDGSPARVLQIRAGGLPIAELSDLDGDGRAEVVLVLDL